MTLATEAANPIPPTPGANPACHAATWFWAAKVAQAATGNNKTTLETLGNIASMNPSAQVAMGQLAQSGTWDFTKTPNTPPDGSVLYWPDGNTHSAVVTGNGQIHGYNQSTQFNNIPNTGHNAASPNDLKPDQTTCKVISEATIVAEATRLNL